MIADLLHRIDFIEKAGTGIRRIREEARAGGYPEPKFEETGFVTAIFWPNPDVRAQAASRDAAGSPEVTGEVGTKLALSRHQVQVLATCVEAQPLTALMELAGRSDRTKFRNQVLGPLSAERFLEMTIPDKPRSSKQRYRITALGREVLRRSASPDSAGSTSLDEPIPPGS